MRSLLKLVAALGAALFAGVLNAAPSPPPLRPDLLAAGPVSLLPADLPGTMRFRQGTAPRPTATWSDVAGGSKVLRLENRVASADPRQATVAWKLAAATARNDVLLVRFFARADYARQESGEALLQFSVEQSAARHLRVLLALGPDWTLVELPLSTSVGAAAGEVEVALAFAALPQAVQIAGLEVLNFGPRVTIGQLPQMRFSYRGREPGAAWRQAALERIEKIRTAPLHLRVLDASTRPVAGARVKVRLVQPQFLFGTAVDASLINADTEQARKYRAVLLAMFDTAVLDNALKWPRWGSSPEARAEALRATDWLEANKLRLRGHNLIWPGQKFLPRWVVNLPEPKAGLPLLFRERIRDVMTPFRGRIVGWDVINEMLHEQYAFKFMPETEAAEWFKLARQIDPHAQLFINEYSMLNDRKSPERIALYLELIRRLQSYGAPIDAIGVQGHVGRQPRDPQAVLSDLDLLAAAGLPVQITEFDLNSPDEELQADYTRDFLIALYSHPTVTGFTKWGFWQSRHWKPDGAMFRADWSEKPNARIWRDLVRGEWLTHLEIVTNQAGQASTRGHLGVYEFTVTAGRKTCVQMRTLTKEGAEVTLLMP